MDTVRETLETNALGPFLLSQTLVPLLEHSRHARIVNISSGMGAFSEMDGDYAAYRLSKTALNAITVILAAELRGRVAVNAACPGWVRTDMGGRSSDMSGIGAKPEVRKARSKQRDRGPRCVRTTDHNGLRMMTSLQG
jgi:NAD(P)-dependent dehydrogenase (short-subunit alcohol dehydrogenase family)